MVQKVENEMNIAVIFGLKGFRVSQIAGIGFGGPNNRGISRSESESPYLGELPCLL